MKIFLKELYLMINTYTQVTGRPSCGWEVITMVADDAIM